MQKSFKNIPNVFSILLIQIVATLSLYGQVTIKIQSLPENTPENAAIYISGSFNNWNSADPLYRLRKGADSVYTVKIDVDSFGYKFTRGDFVSVEGDVNGSPLANRSYIKAKDGLSVDVKILTWEDLEQLRIVISELPKNTPPNATIFLSGDFNYWNPGDPQYKLELNDEGFYEIRLPSFLKSFSYKFTRGDWSSVESNEVGRPTPNRTIDRAQISSLVIEDEIKGWFDLSVVRINVFITFLIISSVLGFFISFAIYQIKTDNRSQNSSLMVLLLLISIVILVKIALYNQTVYYWIPKLILVPGVLIFLYAPLLHNHLQKMILPEKRLDMREYSYFIIPIILLLVLYVPLLPMSNEQFILKITDDEFSTLINVIAGGGIVFNVIYSYRLVRLIRLSVQKMDTTTESFKNHYTYLSSLVLLFSLIVFISLIAFVTSSLSIVYPNINIVTLTDKITSLIWVGLGMFSFFILYFLIIKPDIFRRIERKQSIELSLDLKKSLTKLMESEKPYLNADLTLSTLAERLETNTHTLSKLLNEGYSKNFFDYINGFRVAEFKDRINKGYYKHQTFLAIAFDVGFNSKTTFNRTFKKITGNTPRAYLYSIKDEEIRMKLKKGE